MIHFLLSKISFTSNNPVIIPSTMPITECIGCMKIINLANDSLDTSDANISNATENVPHCNPKTEPKIDAAIILFLEYFSPIFIKFTQNY